MEFAKTSLPGDDPAKAVSRRLVEKKRKLPDKILSLFLAPPSQIVFLIICFQFISGTRICLFVCCLRDIVVETGLESTFDLELHLVSGPILSLLTICVASGPSVPRECAQPPYTRGQLSRQGAVANCTLHQVTVIRWAKTGWIELDISPKIFEGVDLFKRCAVAHAL